MSLSLLVGNRLWGMIVCHNATPRPVSCGHCAAPARNWRRWSRRGCSGWKRNSAHPVSSRPATGPTRLPTRCPKRRTWRRGSSGGRRCCCPGSAARRFSAGSMANPSATAPHANPPTTLPTRPGTDPVRLDDQWVATADPVGVYLTGDARADFTGAVHLPLSPDGGDYLVLGRRERVRTVVWAGAPDDQEPSRTLPPAPRSRPGARSSAAGACPSTMSPTSSRSKSGAG